MANAEDRLFAQSRNTTSPFSVAQAMFKAEAPPPNLGGTQTPGTFDERDYVDSLAVAVEHMRQANVPDQDIQADVGTLELAGAAFRQGNAIVGAFSSHTNAVRRREDASATLTRADVVERARKDGLSSMLHLFGDVDSEAMYEATKLDLAREQQDQKFLASATGLRSGALLLAAGVLDFPTVLPAGSILPAFRGANMARTAASVAAAAGVDIAETA